MPKSKKGKRVKRKLWIIADDDERPTTISFGINFGPRILRLVARREGDRLVVETTDCMTRVEVEPFSGDIRVCFSDRPRDIIVPGSD